MGVKSSPPHFHGVQQREAEHQAPCYAASVFLQRFRDRALFGFCGRPTRHKQKRDVLRQKAPRVPAQKILGEIELKDNRCCGLPQTTLQPSIFVGIGVEQFGSACTIEEPFRRGANEDSVRTTSRDELK